MPNVSAPQLVQDLTSRVKTALETADSSGDGAVDASERASLPADVRPLADNTADTYLSGGPLPIDAYVSAYGNFVSSAVSAADANGSGVLTDAEANNLPASVFNSVAALRASATPATPPPAPAPSVTPTPPATPASLNGLYQTLAAGGWNDDKLVQFIEEAKQQGKVQQFSNEIWDAVLTPEFNPNGHAGARFYEALAWYTDKTLGTADGRISLAEIQAAKNAKAQEYFSHYGDPSKADARRQTWKWLQKLSMLDHQIRSSGATGYDYDAQAMGSVNHSSAWNQANTIDSRAEFNSDVIQASFNKPVLVKYGLTYCMHCLLLEQLDSVHAVANRHANDIDVKKVWWNPHDPAFAELNAIAGEQGVTSSPFFVLYDQGQPVSAGYAFPDENGDGMDALLNGHV
jgi:hypothetical protein